MRISTLISCVVVGIVLAAIVLSVVGTTEAQPGETGMFRVGRTYVTFDYVGRTSSDFTCAVLVEEIRNNWILVRKPKGSRTCYINLIWISSTLKKRFQDGQGVWFNTDYLKSIIELRPTERWQ